MPRGYLLGPDTGGATPQPKAMIDVRISWTIEGNLKDVTGFNLCLTTASGTPLNATTVKKFLFLQNPAARNFIFEKVPEGEYVGWVQTVAPGGDSKWMSSIAVTVSDDGQPTVRGTDDRNIQAFCEDFRAASMPTGFTLTNGVGNLTARSGSLRINGTDLYTDADLYWDVEPWIDAYLAPEAKKTGRPVVIIRAGWDLGMNLLSGFLYIELKMSNGITYQLSKPIINDGYTHDYRIQLGSEITLAGANSATLRIWTDVTSDSGVGKYMWLDAVALGFDNFDMALDGNVDKGITSWNQFDIDPTGGGYFVIAPIRPPGNDGSNQLVIDENGVYWLRDEAGNLVSETGYKLGRQVNANDVPSNTLIPWTSTTYLDPIIPVPEACNKARIVVSKRGSPSWETPLYSPVRQMLAASHIDRDGFRIQNVGLEGGTMYLRQQALAGLGAALGRETMTLNASDDYSSAVTNSWDGWFSAGTFGSPFVLGPAHWMQFVLVEVVMPLKKKANGSYWKVDLHFHASKGDFTPTAITGGSGTGYGYVRTAYYEMLDNYHAVLPTDGRTHICHIIFGNANTALPASTKLNYDLQDISVRYRGRSSESGAPGDVWPTSVKLKRIDYDYLDGASLTFRYYSPANLQLTYLEEFG